MTPAARGVVLVLVARVVSLLTLGFGFGPAPSGRVNAGPDTPVEESPQPAGDNSDVTQGPRDEITGAIATPKPAPLARHLESEVRVLVANDTGVSGAASRVNAQILAYGYNGLPPTNTEPSVAGESFIAVVEGYEDDALAVADLIGITRDRVRPMSPEAPVADLLDAHILVVLGADLVPDVG